MSGLILISDNVKARLKPYRLGRKKDPSFPPISLSCQDSDCHRSLLSLQTHLGLGALLRLLHGRLDPLPCLLPRSCPCTAEPRFPPCTCMMATMLAGTRMLYLGTRKGTWEAQMYCHSWLLGKRASSVEECAKGRDGWVNH